MASMPLSAFPRPPQDNGRGIHWSSSIYHITGDELTFWIDELKAMQIKWVKVLDDSGGTSVELCRRLVENDIMPVVRLYRERPNPKRIGSREIETIKKLVDIGVRYIETNNEPDLPAEWENNHIPPNWLDIVADNFIYDADIVLSLGALPAFPAMSVSNSGLGLSYVVEKGRKDVFEKGAWLAIHNYTTNHPLDYPYDPVNQEGKPLTQEEYERLAAWQYGHLTWEEIEELGIEITRENYFRFNNWAWDGRPLAEVNEMRSRNKNPGATIFDDSNCFRGWELAGHRMYEALGFYIPIISTEGGAVMGWGDDLRYAKVNPTTHAQWQMEITHFMQDEAPPWYFAVCSWLLAANRIGDFNPTWDQMAWYTNAWDLQFGLNGELPIVQLLKDTPAKLRHELRPSTEAAAVTGVVTDPDGKPTAGVFLKLMTKEGEIVASSVSDETGRYELLADPGIYDVFIDWYGMAARDITLTAYDVDVVDIRNIGPAGRYEIFGKVLDANGLILSGLEVHLHRNGVLHAVTKSDAIGKFVFHPGLAGEYTLETQDVSTTVTLTAEDPVISQDIAFPPDAALQYQVTKKRLLSPEEAGNRDIFYGTVRDVYGRGLNGIELEMRWIGADPGTHFPRIKTGPGVAKWDGYYEFLHSRGTFLIEVVQGDHPSEIAEIDTANVPDYDGDHVTFEVDFQLMPVGGEVKESAILGSIPGGRPGQAVHLWKEGDKIADAALDRARSFAFVSLGAGVYDLELAGIGMFKTDIALNGHDQVEVTLPLTGAIVGKVKGVGSGRQAVKLVAETYGFVRHSELDQHGQYRFTNLPAGEYRIELDDDILLGLQCDGQSVLEAPLLWVGMSNALRKSTITGKVHDTANRPAADIEVYLLMSDDPLTTTRTDAGGNFRFEKLAPGVYDVIINQYVGSFGLVLDGENTVEVELLYTPIATAPPKQLNRYYLLQMADAALMPALVRLVSPWLTTQPPGSVGFTITEAERAAVVVLLGDGIPDDVVTLLRDSGCEVVDMRADLLTLARQLALPAPESTGDDND